MQKREDRNPRGTRAKLKSGHLESQINLSMSLDFWRKWKYPERVETARPGPQCRSLQHHASHR